MIQRNGVHTLSCRDSSLMVDRGRHSALCPVCEIKIVYYQFVTSLVKIVKF